MTCPNTKNPMINYPLKTNSRKRLRLLFCLFLFALGGSQILYISLIGYGAVDHQGVLPLRHIQGIWVQGESVFIGLREYARIQEYDLSGRFVRSWPTGTHTQDFNFRVSPQGEGPPGGARKNISTTSRAGGPLYAKGIRRRGAGSDT